MQTNDLKNEFKKFNIDTFGICSADIYNHAMNTNYDAVIVALFPYYCGDNADSDMSIYTHGRDYHLVIREILNSVANELELKNFAIHTDIGPAIERQLAVNAGLCYIARNSMCINRKYGSYFFIGYIAVYGDFEFDSPNDEKCLECGLCVKNCPGGALDDGFCEQKCLSAITQKKSPLTENEQELIRQNKYVFGCDICQKVCPLNKNVTETKIDDFCKNRIFTLDLKELENMSNKQFKQKYGDRAFSWRGKGLLVRNKKIIKNK